MMGKWANVKILLFAFAHLLIYGFTHWPMTCRGVFIAAAAFFKIPELPKFA
jgi:hypothetical protein